MNAEYQERYNKLSELRPGQIAVSKDRKSIFLCGRGKTASGWNSDLTVLDLNSMETEHAGQFDMDQPVRKLKKGDKFTITV